MPQRPRMGRPPRINRAAILRAAERMTVDEISVPNLAKRMGVSVAALYQHVRGRDELLASLGRYVAATLELPIQGDLNWAEWLLAYAGKLRTVFRRFPSALSHVHAGSRHSHEWFDQVETILATLIRAGFSDTEAEKTFLLIADLVLGFVHREVAYAAEVRALPHLRELAVRGPDELPILLRLSRLPQVPGDAEFEEAVRTTLAGVAFRRGETVLARALSGAGVDAPAPSGRKRPATGPARGRSRT
jgi:AcrR family transcriptional regulator